MIKYVLVNNHLYLNSGNIYTVKMGVHPEFKIPVMNFYDLEFKHQVGYDSIENYHKIVANGGFIESTSLEMLQLLYDGIDVALT